MKPNEILDNHERLVFDSTDQALKALHAATIAALPSRNPYKTSDGQVPESFEAPAHAWDVALQDVKAAIDELYGVNDD